MTVSPSPGESGNYSYGTIATFSCEENFTLQGNMSVRCGGDGVWMGNVPVCVGE